MKNIKKIIISSFLAISCFLFVCTKVDLNEKQQLAFNEVVAYANLFSNTQSILNEIKKDISKVETEYELNNEVEIGKLKIDIIKIKEQSNKDIETKEKEAFVNKSKYKSQRDSITNKYYGTENQYNNELLKLNTFTSAAYSSYLKDVNKVNNEPYLGSGYKAQYCSQRYNQYLNEIRPYQTQKSILETQWKNKQDYDKYNDLYNSVEENLKRDIQNLENKRDKDINNLIAQINTLIKNRYKQLKNGQ